MKLGFSPERYSKHIAMKVCLLPSTDLLTVPCTHIVHTFLTIILLPILIEGPAHCLRTLGFHQLVIWDSQLS